MSHHNTHDQHRRILSKDDLDAINESISRHHEEQVRAQDAWFPNVMVWAIFFGLLYKFVGDVFFPAEYFIYAWAAISFIARLAVGLNFGVRV